MALLVELHCQQSMADRWLASTSEQLQVYKYVYLPFTNQISLSELATMQINSHEWRQVDLIQVDLMYLYMQVGFILIRYYSV